MMKLTVRVGAFQVPWEDFLDTVGRLGPIAIAEVRGAMARPGPVESKPEVEQELPLALYTESTGVLRRRLRLMDLLALLPTLSPEQQDAIWEVQCGAAGRNRLRVVEQERDAYRRAKEENDDRFMRERDEARQERDAAIARAESAERKHSATVAAGLTAEARVAELEGKLANESGERGRLQDRLAALARERDRIDRLRDDSYRREGKASARVAELRAQVASVAERQREACAQSYVEASRPHAPWSWAMDYIRITPLVTDTAPSPSCICVRRLGDYGPTINPECSKCGAQKDSTPKPANHAVAATCGAHPLAGHGGEETGIQSCIHCGADPACPHDKDVKVGRIKGACFNEPQPEKLPAWRYDITGREIRVGDRLRSDVDADLAGFVSSIGAATFRFEEGGTSANCSIRGLPHLRIVDPPTQEGEEALDEYTDERCNQEMATLGWDPSPRCVFNVIKRRNARIAELECIHRVDEEVNIRLDAESVRLRAKCSRQRRELRAKNQQVRAVRGGCMRLKYELDSAIETLKVYEGELSALRAENERLGKLVTFDSEIIAMKDAAIAEVQEENEKLRARESPEAAWERLAVALERDHAYKYPYQPPQEAPAETSRCTCRPAPWFGYADDCPKHGANRKAER